MDSVWFAKLDDGRVYGPVGVAKLAAWAREGRLDSTSLISQDRVNWTPAPQKAALGMNWIVETAVGTWFGPFHRDVIEELYKANQVPSGARLYRLTPRQSAAANPASALPSPAAVPPADAKAMKKLEDTAEELRKKLEAAERECKSLAQENEALAKENGKLAKENGQLVREKERLAKESEKLAKENEKLAKAKKGKGLGGLLFGKSEIDFAKLEQAAQRELAAAKQRSESKAAVFSPQDVIDIA